jgi:hypothetical protein
MNVLTTEGSVCLNQGLRRRTRRGTAWALHIIAAFSAIVLALMLPVETAVASDLHKLAIHVDRDDAVTLKLAINNANKAWAELQPDIAIKVVVYGPGIALVTKGGTHEQSVLDLIDKGVQYYLCDVTVQKMVKELGRSPDLVKGVNIVPSGTVKLLELQEQGFAYLRP